MFFRKVILGFGWEFIIQYRAPECNKSSWRIDVYPQSDPEGVKPLNCAPQPVDILMQVTMAAGCPTYGMQVGPPVSTISISSFLRPVLSKRISEKCLVNFNSPPKCSLSVCLLSVTSRRCQELHPMASNGGIIHKGWSGRDLEGSDRGIIDVFPRYLPGGAEESH
jgi:hypothetical protein